MQGIKISFFPLYNLNGPSSRYRVYQYLHHLRELGIRVRLLEAPEKRPLKRFWYLPRLFALAISSDILFVQKRLFPGWVLDTILRLNSRLIYDFDDSIFLRAEIRQNFDRMVRSATAVIAGNEYLANYARKLNPSVATIPTVIDTNIYHPAKLIENSKTKPLILGWIGINPNRGDFDGFRPILDRLYDRFNDLIVLKIVSDQPLNLSTKIRSEFELWSLDKSIKQLQSFDIGIMPLQDNEWNKGKCGFKTLQYMAVGVANVSSNVGVNKDIVIDGKTGYLASSVDEWKEHISTLIEKENLRKSMGTESHKRVEEYYSVNYALPQLVELIDRTSIAKVVQ